MVVFARNDLGRVFPRALRIVGRGGAGAHEQRASGKQPGSDRLGGHGGEHVRAAARPALHAHGVHHDDFILRRADEVGEFAVAIAEPARVDRADDFADPPRKAVLVANAQAIEAQCVNQIAAGDAAEDEVLASLAVFDGGGEQDGFGGRHAEARQTPGADPLPMSLCRARCGLRDAEQTRSGGDTLHRDRFDPG